MGKQKVKPNYRRRLLRLPDLDHCKRAVLNSLGSPASRRVYEHAIDQFIAGHNANPKPFRWTKSADDILASVERFCRYNAPAAV